MPHISDIYAAQLGTLGHGHPLWFPERLGGSNTIEIGDVGYIERGAFVELFSAAFPADHERNHGRAPPGHVPLSYDKTLCSVRNKYLLPSWSWWLAKVTHSLWCLFM